MEGRHRILERRYSQPLTKEFRNSLKHYWSGIGRRVTLLVWEARRRLIHGRKFSGNRYPRSTGLCCAAPLRNLATFDPAGAVVLHSVRHVVKTRRPISLVTNHCELASNLAVINAAFPDLRPIFRVQTP